MAHSDGVVITLDDPRVREWWTPSNMRSHRLRDNEISEECCLPYGDASEIVCTHSYCQCSCHAMEIPEGLI